MTDPTPKFVTVPFPIFPVPDVIRACTVVFAVQDGMTVDDVPSNADVIFVGGTTEWKWQTVAMWCKAFQRVHVGRVNEYKRLWMCHDAGAESCDGSGWTRGDQRQFRGLLAYLEESTNGGRVRQMEITCGAESPIGTWTSGSASLR